MGMSGHFLGMLQTTMRQQASRRALVHQGRELSYCELDVLARKGAAHLPSLGVVTGERVVLVTGNKLAFLAAHLATLYAGAVSLPLNPRFTREELRFFLSDCGARIAVVDENVRPVVESLQVDLPELKAIVPDASLLNAPAAAWREPTLSSDDPCLMLYSSGTTGWPKGVVHTHANVASSLSALQRSWRMTPDDVVLNVLPLFHIHGLCFATQLTLLSGGCIILDEFQPLGTLQRLSSCTVFMAVPTIYYRLLELPEFRAAVGSFSRTRLFTCGSAPIRAEVLPDLETILGRPVINRYGMSEAFVIASLPLDGPWPHGSVGLPLDGIEVRVTTDDDRTARPSEVGAVQIRGSNLFREYWHQPDVTRAAFAAGWFETGDLGYRDERGFLTLVGRRNDLIITSGYNVYPQVVERVINSCPGVRECAVVGIADAHKGERVAAAVVRTDPAMDEGCLRDYLSERLVDYQRPKQIVFVEALPRNAMGKVLRRELRDRIEQSK
jgi:malonyl-CoA/methylmalonyl-CoA synthetase